MKNEKHVALAAKILSHLRYSDNILNPANHGEAFQKNLEVIVSALQQVESEAQKEIEELKYIIESRAVLENEAYERGKSEALAAKVVGPSDEEINKAALNWCAENQYNDKKDRGTSFIEACHWLRSQLTLAPNEQVISPDIDKKEISNDMSKKCEKCDQSKTLNEKSDISRCEPEVKAQGFEELAEEYARECRSEYEFGHQARLGHNHLSQNHRETLDRIISAALKKAFFAGQKSKAATLKLPEKDIFINKWSEIVNDWNGGERKPLELFYNWLTDAVKSMNEGSGDGK